MARPTRPSHVPEPGPAPLAGSGGAQPPGPPPPIAIAEPGPRPQRAGPSAILFSLGGDTRGQTLELRDALEMEFVIVATGQRAKGLIRRGQTWLAVLGDGQEVAIPTGALLRSSAASMRFLAGPNLEEQYHQQVYDLACRDQDTGTFSREFFDSALRHDVQAAHRLQKALALAFLRLPELDDTASLLDRLCELVSELGQLRAGYLVVARFDRRTLALLAGAADRDELQAEIESMLERAKYASELAAMANSVLRPGEDADDFLARVLTRLPS